MLKKSPASIDILDRSRRSLAHHGALAGRVEVLELLLSKKANMLSLDGFALIFPIAHRFIR